MAQKQGDVVPLTKARLQAIKARSAPAAFLRTFASKLDEHGEDLLEGLFEIAKGAVKLKQRGGQVVSADFKDRLAAIKLIAELGGFRDVMKVLLEIAAKGRPVDGSETQVPEWVKEYTDQN